MKWGLMFSEVGLGTTIIAWTKIPLLKSSFSCMLIQSLASISDDKLQFWLLVLINTFVFVRFVYCTWEQWAVLWLTVHYACCIKRKCSSALVKGLVL